jgi:hypothetical protein
MTLRVSEAPSESVEAIRGQLSELAGRAQFRHRALARANPVNVALAAPHDVYFLGLDELAQGASIEAARPVAQRFLVMDGDTAVASAEITGRDGSGFQANEGPFVASTAAAIVRAEAAPELAEGDYEIRLLRIPALYFVALWLHDSGGHGDVVVPLDPAPAPFEPDRHYTPAEVLSELAGQARQRSRFDDVGQG